MTGFDLSALDLSGLAHEEVQYPPEVSGRTVQIDADFLAYQVSYEKDDDPKSPEDMKHNAAVAVEHIRRMAAAEKVHLHLTPFTSTKGGRYDQAIQRIYQGNRTDKPKPRMLHVMRNWFEQNYTGTQWQHCEADDGMSSFQYAAIKAGHGDLSVIASKDKDLDMVPGLHMVWDTGELVQTLDDFGWVELQEKVSASGAKSSKLKGYGHKWFWAQMLIGDTADNIQGIPKICGRVLNKIDPTAAVIKAQGDLTNMRDEKSVKRAHKVLTDRKPKACGPALAIKILNMVRTNKQAFDCIKARYEEYGQEVGFKDYNGQSVNWQQVFISEAQLLWMRRNAGDPNDVIHWFKEINA